MRYVPQMLMVGSAARNAGKTEFATAVIRKFSARSPVVALKVTTVDKADGACPRGGEGCGVCSSLTGPYMITEETKAGPGKDTERLLEAGAAHVYWLRVLRDHLEEGIEALLALAGDGVPLVCESNSLRTVLEPSLFLMARRPTPSPMKASAAQVQAYVDRFVNARDESFADTLAGLDTVDGRWTLREPATAVVLAGGQSKRMGRDKTLMPIDGVPMTTRLCNTLRPHFGQILVSTQDPTKYGDIAAELVTDEAPGQGPLMGIASALKASRHDLNLVVACDIPNVSVRAIRGMLRAANAADAVVPMTEDGRIEPLFAVYRKGLLPRIEEALASGERKVRMAFSTGAVCYIKLPQTDWPYNLNTPEDYQAYISQGTGSHDHL